MLVLKQMKKDAPPPWEPASWSTGTNAEISETLQKYYNDEITINELSAYWGIGDERVIHLNAMQAASPNGTVTMPEQDITVIIVAYDHTDLETPINNHTKACITVQTKECLHNLTANESTSGHVYINGDSDPDTTFTKWSNLYMKTYLNDKVLNAFQSNFKSMIKPSKHYRHTTYDGSASEEVIDTLFLPSYPEIWGTDYSEYAPTNPAEGTQWEYYGNGDTTRKIKYGNNNGNPNNVAQNWWTSSACSFYSSSGGYYWQGVAFNGTQSPTYGRYGYALAPAWAM